MARGLWALAAHCAAGAWAAAAATADAREACDADDVAMLQRGRTFNELMPTRGVPEGVDDLLLLSGATNDNVNLTAAALAELGWEPGVVVADTTHAARGVLDHAQTWSKGRRCVAAFASTNDDVDMQQVVGGFSVAPVSFCGFEVHAGVVDEMAGFMRAPNWAEFIAALHAPACKSVTAVGHSLGGSLATLFAACANKGDPTLGFGQRSDYRLVTFAPFAISSEPVYNGRPGRRFRGTRFNTVEAGGGRAGPEAALPADTRPFRVSTMELVDELAQSTEQTAVSEALHCQKKVIRKWTEDESWDDEKEAAFQQHWLESIEPIVKPFLLPIFALSANPPANLQQWLAEATQGGFLYFAYDPVGALSQLFGFQHALQNFQPLAHPLKTPGSVVFDKIPASEAARFPQGDSFQIGGSILASGYLPNHGLCCLSSDTDCAAKFTMPWFACADSPFR